MTIDDHLPLAPRVLMILAVLAEGPLHGYGVIKAVEERSESAVRLDPANLYRVLRRMKGFGWILPTEFEEESRRRTYTITPVGREVLAAELARLRALLERAGPLAVKGTPRNA